MKKFFLAVCLCMGVWAAFAQPQHRVVRYANGLVRYEGYFEGNKPVGELRRYHENGKLSCVQQFDEAGNSEVVFYTGAGYLLAKGQYKGQKRDGDWKFYGEGEYLFMTESYDAGKRIGETLVYSREGKVLQRIPYQNGVIHGERIHYYPYGNILAKYTYQNGELNGPYRYFYETGQLNEEGDYLDGKPHGIWRSYEENGSFDEVEFVEGKPAHPELYNKQFQDKLDSYDVDPQIKDPEDFMDNPSAYFQ
jgi:antitoxin component YwqK of YwqJK toxin-antitoxin module